MYKAMLLYCLKCRKTTESENSKNVKIENRRIMLLSKCEVCASKTLKFIKKQEASGLLSNIEIKIPLIKLPLLGPALF